MKRIITSLLILAFSFGVSAQVASAHHNEEHLDSFATTLAPPDTTDLTELQAYIEQLQAVVADLTDQITDAASDMSGMSDMSMANDHSDMAMSEGCSFVRNLTIGSTGDDVTCLQDFLTEHGHYHFSGGSTGYFGEITRAALADWQAEEDITPAVGYFGPISMAAYVEHEQTESMEDDNSMSSMEMDDNTAGMEGIHIMADGTVMLGNGETLTDATVTDDGMIMLHDGTMVTPVMDMRPGHADANMNMDSMNDNMDDTSMNDSMDDSMSDSMNDAGM